VNETMLLPSTRNVFGFSKILRYYRQLAEDGTSPFQTPQIVVSYHPEVLYRDELLFQFLAIPEKDSGTIDYLCHVRFEDISGQGVFSSSTRNTVLDQQHDALCEVRFDTTDLFNMKGDKFIPEILSPVVSVECVDRVTNKRKAVYQNLRLAPIILRYNKLRHLSANAIDLAHVAADTELGLKFSQQPSSVLNASVGELAQVEATASGKEQLRRITLSESRMASGAFRLDDAKGNRSDGKICVFLRIRCEDEFNYTLNVDGDIIERYCSNYKSKENTVTINASSFTTKSFPNGKGKGKWGAMQNSIGKPVFRILADPAAKIKL